jgi:hypothetical protein
VRHALVLAGLCALLTACGAGEEQHAAPPPRLPAEIAGRLAQRADAVAARLDAGDPCAAAREALALQQASTDAINARRVPRRFQEELQSSVGELAADAQAACARVPPATTTEKEHGRGKHKGKKKHGDGGE